MNKKTGLFLCNCGFELNEFVSFGELEESLSKLPHVEHVQTLPDLCMKPGKMAVAEAVEAKNLDRVLCLACSVRTHSSMLADSCEAAGIDRNLVEFVDLKAVCATSGGDKGNALTKVREQGAMATARLNELEVPETIEYEPLKSVAVIGGGVAGLSAAWMTSLSQVATTVIEKSRQLGGRASTMKVEFPALGVPLEEIARQAKDLGEDEQSRILLESTVKSVSGQAGNYKLLLDTPEGETEVEAGAIILATGSQAADATGLYGLGDLENVVSQEDFDRTVEISPDMKNIVFVQCAGSRDENRPYCSRACCLVALKQASFIKKNHPDINVHFVFRDIQTGGTNLRKLIYHGVKWGMEFHQFDKNRLPLVEDGNLSFFDQLRGEETSLSFDKLVVAPGSIARGENAILAEQLKLARDDYGFIIDTLTRAKPQDHPMRGVFVVGGAHWPCNMQEASNQGAMAASEALRLIQNKQVNNPAVSSVDQNKCIACRLCFESCGMSAIEMQSTEDGMKAFVDPRICNGCGTCAAACPVFAIRPLQYEDNTISAQLAAGSLE